MESLEQVLKRFAQTSSSTGTSSSRGPAETADQDNHCDVCDDARWLSLSAPVGSPDFGRLVPCQCLLRSHALRRVERLTDYSELGSLSRLTFESLDPQGHEPFADPASFRKANETAKTYAANPEGWLVVCGPSGVGKTHLAAAVVNHAMRQGTPGKFIFVPEFLDRLRTGYNDQAAGPQSPSEARHAQERGSGSTFEELMMVSAAAPLLVLDDFGAQSSTPWAEEKLQQIFAHRFDNRLPTVITTRRQPDAIDEWLKARVMDPSFARLIVIKAGAMNADLTDVGIEPRLRDAMTFENFDPRGGAGASAGQRETLRDALATTQSFAADPDRWLYLAGPTGVGKTHLAVAIAVARLRRGQPVTFRFVPDLLDHLRRTFGPDSQTTYDRAFERLKNAELLVLDDFGAQASTPWAEEKLYQLVVHRHNAWLPTVITSRILLDEMAPATNQEGRSGRRAEGIMAGRYAEAILSRLRDGNVVVERLLAAPDFRNRGVRATRTPLPKPRSTQRQRQP